MSKLAPGRNGAPTCQSKGAAVHWSGVIRRWERSGLSQADFCRRRSIPVGTFSSWKWRLGVAQECHPAAARQARRPAAPRQPSTPPLFYPVRVVDSRSWSPAPLEVVLAGGRVLRVRADFDAAVLCKLVSTLERAPC